MKWQDLQLAKESFRITSLGRYHIIELVANFQYYDAIVVDTPILDDESRKAITDTPYIDQRIPRAVYFMKYLNQCAEQIQDADARKIWSGIHESVMSSIDRVKGSLQRTREADAERRRQEAQRRNNRR